MFAKFQRAAVSCGFSPLPEDRFCLDRTYDFFLHSVALNRSRHNKGETVLRLYVCIKDRFEEPSTYPIALSAYLHPDQVAILFYGDPRTWKEEEEEVAIGAFMKFGLPWFESSRGRKY
jgi:hypothetical protein